MTPTEPSWERSILVPSADPAVKTGARYGRRQRRSTAVYSQARPLRWKTILGPFCAMAVKKKRFLQLISCPSATREYLRSRSERAGLGWFCWATKIQVHGAQYSDDSRDVELDLLGKEHRTQLNTGCQRN